MSEESRLGREAIETAYALKQLVQAGVRVFFYLEDRERTLDSPTDKIMLSLTAFADELEREKARQRTYDAMMRKARPGHVTGGRVFGYDNVEVPGPDGKRAHVVRRVNAAEATVVRHIFELSKKGHGLNAMARLLNAEGALAPRAQQGRPRSWAPSSIREVLYRPLYRGVVVWNQTRKRNPWGQVQQRARQSSEWISIDAPALRIISEELWRAVHERLDESRRQYLRGTKGQLWGRPARSGEAKHLLPGLARCGTCNGSMYVKSRDHGKRRAYFYGCTSFHLRGSTVCTNSLEVPMERSDLAVLASIERDILQPDVITATLRKALERLKPQAAAAQDARQGIEKRLATVERDLERLTAAVTAGGELSTLVTAIKERESAREALRLELRAIDMAGKAATLDLKAVECDLRAKLDEWKAVLGNTYPRPGRCSRSSWLACWCLLPTAKQGNGDQSFRHRSRLVGLSAV